MTGGIALLIMVIGVVLAVVFGNKFKVNIGILCMGLTYIIGCFVMGQRVTAVVGLFPVKIFFLIFSVTYFFGFHTQNGTFQVLADKMMYASRNHPWAVPIMLALATAVVSLLGAGSTGGTVIVAPIAYLMGVQAGFNPLFMGVIAGNFATIGAIAPWGPIGAMLRGVCTGIYDDEVAATIGWHHFLAVIFFNVIIFVIGYFVFRCYKAKPVQMDKPKEFNHEQKKSLVIIIIFLILVIVPMLGKTIIGGPFFGWLANYMDVQMLAIVGGIVCSFMKMGDEREILTKQVPWGLILLSGGISAFIALCSNAGAIEVIATWMSNNLPGFVATPVVTFLGAAISFVADTINVGMNALGGAFPGLAAATGISMFSLIEAFQLGGCATMISPFSMGGSLVLSLQPDEKVRNKQFIGQILFALAQTVIMVLLALVGFFNLFG